MKERHNSKLKRLVLTILLLFLTSFTLPAANRSATPTFGSKTITAISRTQSGEWVLGGCLKTVQLKVVMWLVFPASFRSEHGKLNTEHFLFTITQPSAVTTFTHDKAGRILTQTAKDSDGSVLVADTFTYDDAGNITHKTETRGDETWDIDYEYTYDHRLSGYTIKQGNSTLQTVAFQYDDAGNRTKETYEGTENKTVENTYNEMNQLVSSRITNHESQVTVVDYSYDQGGRLTSSQVTDHESQVTSVAYGYNPFGNLVSVTSTTPQATSEAAYTYSYDGKRISKYIDGTLYDYTYTGSNLLETYADTAGRIAKYTYGNALISQSDATGSSESVVTDYQNSVIALLNPSTIHDPLSTAFAYDPFGKVRYTNNPDTPQGLTWLSRQYDPETGNNYLINRYYNADRGSFLSPDRYQYVNTTIPFTFNLYQYAYANPLVNVDPEGLFNNPETLVKQRMLMQMTDEQRQQFIHDDLEMQKGMAIDMPIGFAKGIAMTIPTILKLSSAGLQQQYNDTTQFISNMFHHGVETAIDKQEAIQQARSERLKEVFHQGFESWKKKMATDPRFVGEESGTFLVMAFTAVDAGISMLERMAARALSTAAVEAEPAVAVEPAANAERMIKNPWNGFQHAMRGKFKNPTEAAAAYQRLLQEETALETYGSKAPLGYDISKWPDYGLPSDGYFSRMISKSSAKKLLNGESVSLAGVRGKGFIASAEELRHLRTSDEMARAMGVRYLPDYLLEFQLENYEGLQNLIEYDDSLWRYGGKTINGFSEFNYPGLNSDQIINFKIRELIK